MMITSHLTVSNHHFLFTNFFWMEFLIYSLFAYELLLDENKLKMPLNPTPIGVLPLLKGFLINDMIYLKKLS